MARLSISIALALAACSGNGGPGASTDDPAPASPRAPDPAPEPTPTCTRPAFLDRYGPLTTIAGTGRDGRKDHNGWQASMEGGSALEAELSRPHIAMADATGAIYIADKDAHAIRRVATDGAIATVAGTGARGDDGDAAGPANRLRLSHPNGLWVRADGALYILDLGSDAIRRVDPSGEMTTLIRLERGISIGRGLWVADDESRAIIASGDRIVQWTAGGGGEVLADGFRQLGNLYRLDTGDVLATDRGASRVYRVGADGTRSHIAGGGTRSDDCAPATDLDLEGVRGVWPHAGGYFLATHSGSSVWFVDSDGFGHRFLDADDGIDEVRGITIDTTGRLIIVDDDAGFVRVMAPPS